MADTFRCHHPGCHTITLETYCRPHRGYVTRQPDGTLRPVEWRGIVLDEGYPGRFYARPYPGIYRAWVWVHGGEYRAALHLMAMRDPPAPDARGATPEAALEAALAWYVDATAPLARLLEAT